MELWLADTNLNRKLEQGDNTNGVTVSRKDALSESGHSEVMSANVTADASPRCCNRCARYVLKRCRKNQGIFAPDFLAIGGAWYPARIAGPFISSYMFDNGNS